MAIGYYYVLAALIFSTGLAGVMLRRNVIVLFMCVELMLNAVNLTLVAAARQWGEGDGHAFAFFVIAVAAAEVVVGLGLIVNIFFRRGTLDVDAPRLLRW